MWKNRKVLLAVCGGIAAYKMALLVRLLIKEGAEVQVVMTESAKDFITPLTLSTLSKRPVLSTFFKEETGSWNNHVDLGLWADCMLIAPATANTLAKMANGLSDNLLLTTWLSARCPVFVAPAMDLDMWQHPASQQNLDKLASWGVGIVPPGDGELASGLRGKGRLAEPEEILSFMGAELSAGRSSVSNATTASQHGQNGNLAANSPSLAQELPLFGKKALVTAGPTHESIDPVRFIGNHSSGKMGMEIADRLSAMGATVTLVSGPSKLQPSATGIVQIKVKSAAEMFEACSANFSESDIFVAAAAVADYTPANPSDIKIKKKAEQKGQPFSIELKRTKDILGEMGKRKSAGQLLVGFALETNNELENAKRKLKKKNLDFIVLNSLQDKGAGFQHNTNKVTIIDSDEKVVNFDLKPKSAVAADIVDQIIVRLSAQDRICSLSAAF